MSKMSRKAVLACLGASPDAIGAALAEFSETARILSSDHPRLIDAHPQQWIGVFDGAVTASAPDQHSLMKQLASKNVPPSQTIVRFIDRNQKTFIL